MYLQGFNNSIFLNKSKSDKTIVKFGMHSEFSRLISQGEIRGSNFFRRSTGIYGFQSREFEHVETAIKETLSRIKRPKILIVGVGSGQEPLSFLAIINSLIKNETLSKRVNLNCVDLQPQINDWRIISCSGQQALFAEDSFEKVAHASGEYLEIKPHILNYLKQVFQNPRKSKWDTQIEDFAAKSPSSSYDMISMNNVLAYIKDSTKRVQVMADLRRMLKNGGTIITDPGAKEYLSNLNPMKEQAPGIFKDFN